MEFCEKTFSLENKEGCQMYGITHTPTQPNGCLVVMFNIGLHYRVSHSRLFVTHARYLQERGFHVTRIDTGRIGYGQGEIIVERAIDAYDSVQTGLFKDDAIKVINYLNDKIKPKKIYLYGLCGGALTAIIAGALEEKVSGVIFSAGPVTVTSAETEATTIHPIQAKINLVGYLNRLTKPEAWLRFFSGRTSYKRLFRSLKVKLDEKFARSKNNQPQHDSPDNPGLKDEGDLFNRVFYQAFKNMMQLGKEIIFVMPELDRATYDFEKFFNEPILKKQGDLPKNIEIATIPKADHTFSRPESSQRLFEITAQWLQSRID